MADSSIVRFKVEPGFPSQDELKLRVSPDALDALKEALEAEDLHSGPVIEASQLDLDSTVAYLVYSVTAVGLTAERLASAISKWSHRHDGKKIEYDDNGRIKSTSGFSMSEAQYLVDDAIRRKRLRDEEWEELNRQHPPPDMSDGG